MTETLTLQQIVFVVGSLVSPLYAIMLWRMKVSSSMKSKLDKLCTAFQIEFPQHKGLFRGT